MKFSKILGLTAVLFLCSWSQAHALSVSALGGLGWTNPSISTPGVTNVSSKLGAGYGGAIEIGLVPFFSLEADVLDMKRKFQFDTAAVAGIGESANYLQIPVMLRFSPLSLVSVGGGFYYANGLGNVSTSVGGVAGADQTFAQAGLKNSDFGMVLSGRLRLPIMPLVGIIVDARYLLGLTNVATDPTATIKYRDIQTLFGINFML